MKLDIDSIKRGDKGTLDLNFALDLDTIGFDGDNLQIVSPVEVDGKLYVIEDRLYISFNIKTDIQAHCNRCLESFIYPFKSSVNAEVVHEKLSKDYDETVDEDIIYYEDKFIYLDEVVKENIIVNIPMKLVCDKGCQGLCSKCGAKVTHNHCGCVSEALDDKDIDPRLAKLKKFL